MLSVKVVPAAGAAAGQHAGHWRESTYAPSPQSASRPHCSNADQGPLRLLVVPLGLPLRAEHLLAQESQRWTITVEMAATSPQGGTCAVAISY
jgi:hypothetical protein